MDDAVLTEQQNRSVAFEECSSYATADDKVPNNEAAKPVKKRIRCIDSDSDSDDKENEEAKNKRKSVGTKVSRKRNKYGETPMHTACKKGDLAKVKELVQQGYSLHQTDKAGWYPLHETSNYYVAEYLISQGARVDVRNNKEYGWLTPLMDAAVYGHLYIMQLLMEHGANTKLKDIKGRTALDILTAWKDQNPISDTALLAVYNNVVDMLTKENTVEEVFLLIPSMLGATSEALDAVYRELGINCEQCVVWPDGEKFNSLKDGYLPHLMLDIVNSVRNDDVDSFSQIILSTGRMEKYEYLTFHGGQNDIVIQEVFGRIEEILDDINRKHQNLGRLLSGKSEKTKILAMKFSARQSVYKDVVSQLLRPLFEWSNNIKTSFRGMASKPERVDEEYEALWKWLKSRIRTNFEIVTCPERKATVPEHKILWSKKFSSKVIGKLTSKLLELLQRPSLCGATCTTVWIIDGANRDVLKYKSFVRQVIERVKNKPEEMVLIVGVKENDEISSISDVVPSQLEHNTRMYSAFNPEKARISCFVIHVKQMDADGMANSIDPDQTVPKELFA